MFVAETRPTCHLICGLPGAGKSTLARSLESQGAVRFCPDEWIHRIIHDAGDRTELDRLRTPVEQIQWSVALTLLRKGLDVVVENGFWSRNERLLYLADAGRTGAEVVLHYLDVPFEVLWSRIARRNGSPSDSFFISRDDFDSWRRSFEPPTPEEVQRQGRFAHIRQG